MIFGHSKIKKDFLIRKSLLLIWGYRGVGFVREGRQRVGRQWWWRWWSTGRRGQWRQSPSFILYDEAVPIWWKKDRFVEKPML
jgi:hypothetical protein